MKKMVQTKLKAVVAEVNTVEEANQLYASGEWGLPRYSERRDKYVLVRLKGAV